MLRGAIDYYDGLSIGGWLYSSAAPVRDVTVLAFLDGACVGAGKVDTLRPDLAAAGLGDGYCGFNFVISLPDPADAERVTVKLEASDFMLLQRGAKVVGAAGITAAAAPQAGRSDYSVDSLEWMRDQSWFDQTAFDFLKHVSTIGIYDRSLRSANAAPLDPAGEAKRLFELYHQGPVKIQEALIELRNLAEERAMLADGALIPVIAVHAPAGAIRLLEGSRNEKKSAQADFAGATRHNCRNDRLLLLDTRATFTGETAETARIYRAI